MHLLTNRLPFKKIVLNTIIKTLAISDSFLWFGYYMFTPILAIHLKSRIDVNAIIAIANSFSIYLITRAVIQIPVSAFLDKNNSFKDEVHAILLGSTLLSISFLLYVIVDSAISLYLVSFLYGLGNAIYLPSWRKVFSTHVDTGHEGSNYSFADILLTGSGAIATAFGGYLVEATGTFTYVFYIAAFISLLGGLIAHTIAKKVR